MHAAKIASLLLPFALLTLTAVSARAEYMQTTGSLSAGHLGLGAEFQAGVGVPDTPMYVNLHEMVGLAGGLDLYARQGLGLEHQPFLFAAGIKWTILSGRHDRPGVALIVGGHYVNDWYAGGEASLLVDYTIGRATPFIGLGSAIDFGDRAAGDDGDASVDFKLGLVGGVRISVVKNVAWFVEGGVGFTGGPKPHYLSTGPKITI